jgi:hypothetical protein
VDHLEVAPAEGPVACLVWQAVMVAVRYVSQHGVLALVCVCAVTDTEQQQHGVPAAANSAIWWHGKGAASRVVLDMRRIH